ncbi:hypothetical protein SY83_09245 [Paenibacillus swuensis]|uniref:F5/8 type C domain-containing protein n=1 Tax=Paenibacillus swuensis TaxID=1178515 RepID=A0A172THA0_9BACL|nr:discoidin domain-containing protein [Paenibacillus swuensis]ANE46428.1 hypothetical protein SY83_09245 [Paenibacillus swuensis]
MKNKIISMLLTAVLSVSAALPASALHWEHVPWVSEKILNNGFQGGEVSQWPQALAIDSQSGEFALMATDVGGVLRSLDGGENWAPANIKLNSRGGNALAIDPRNSNRVLLVGGNSGPHPDHGLFLSTDQAQTWKNVYKAEISGFRDVRDQLAYDISSFDETAGYTKTAYWLRVADEQQQWGNVTEHPALYRTSDGGETWTELPNTNQFGNGILKVHPTKGYIYIANGNGLFRSKDEGATFTRISEHPLSGLDVIPTSPDRVYYITGQDIYLSEDSGDTFQKVETTRYPVLFEGDRGGQYGIKVSPANPDYMMTTVSDGAYGFDKYVSHDGGVTWTKAVLDNTNSFMPFNGRPALYAWHPSDENVILSIGGDYITKSVDGGLHFSWANNGNPGVMPGGNFNFNVKDPDLLFIGSQDYAGAFTTDGGITWQYTNVQDFEWGGWTYGTYMVNPKVMFGASKHWDIGMAKTIHITRDGGKSFTRFKDKVVNGMETSYGAPDDDNILFCYEYRSTDQGYSWVKMEGADGVFIHNFDPEGKKELYGGKGNKIVSSADQGETWTEEFSVDGTVNDVAYDWKNKLVYAVTKNKLFQFNQVTKVVQDLTSTTPADQYGNHHLWSIAIDPKQPEIVYAAGPANTYNATVSTIRSVDAGQTWENLTIQPGASVVQTGKDGGREAWGIRVHPENRYVYVGSICYGFWRIAPPYGESVSYDSKPLKAAAGNGEVTLKWFGNGRETLLDVADLARHSTYGMSEVPVQTRLTYDLDGDRQVTATDMDIRSRLYLEGSARSLDTFTVYRREGSAGEWTKIAENLTNISYVDRQVINGTAYEYKVENTSKQQSTVTVTAMPAAAGPSAIFASPSPDAIEILWSQGSGTYSIYRTEANAEQPELLASGLQSASYTDRSVTKGNSYRYYVTSTGTGGESEPSATVTASTLIMTPPLLQKVDGRNLAWNKKAESSAANPFNEAARAVDGQLINNSKWSDNSAGDKWLSIDLGASYTLDRWVVKHASSGGEDTSLNTKSFQLQQSADGVHWSDLDTVTNNTQGVTDRKVNPFKSRYVRLYITAPT